MKPIWLRTLTSSISLYRVQRLTAGLLVLATLSANAQDDIRQQILRVDLLSAPASTTATAELDIWVELKNAPGGPSKLRIQIPSGSLAGKTLVGTPSQGIGDSQAISKVELQCLDDQCLSFDAQLFFVGQSAPVPLQRRRQARLVQVYTSLEPSKAWYKPAEIDLYGIPNGFSAFRLREFLNDSQLSFDIEGGLTASEGVCRGLAHYQPWRQRVQTCLIGAADDGSFIVRMKPTVVIRNATIPFDLPMDAINAAFLSTQDVSIFLKVMPEGFALPKPQDPTNPNSSSEDGLLDISRLPPAFTNSDSGMAMIKEIEDAAHFPAVHDRIINLWMAKWRSRLIQFLTVLKAGAPYKESAPHSRAKDAQLMMMTLEKNNFPQVTALVTLIESDFYPTPPNNKAAAGYWQFIPATAADYGIIVNDQVDQRMQIIPSTQGALRYLKDLMLHFKGPHAYKLALASYNSGQRAVDRQRDALRKRETQAPAVRGAGQDQVLAPTEAFAAAHNFWDLYTYHLLYEETRNYVVDIMAASYLSLHPEIAHLDVKLALDRAMEMPAAPVSATKKVAKPPLKLVAPVKRKPAVKLSAVPSLPAHTKSKT